MEKKIIEPIKITTTRLVKSEDLNHHGTLFAGRTAEWFVEAGFISAARLVPADDIVCLKIHGLHFTKPAKPGEIIQFNAKVVYTGRTSMISYIEVTKDSISKPFVSGFITFINVDETTKPASHNIEVQPQTEEDKILYEQAANLKK